MLKFAFVNNDIADNSALDANLLTQGCSIDIIRNARFAKDVFSRRMPDFVIINLPTVDMDAIELLKAIRERSTIPVILRADVVSEVEHIIALHFGVDDYVPKSLSSRFLAERIKAIVRRQDGSQVQAEIAKTDERIMTIGDMVIDPPRHEVRWKGDKVDVTSTEFQMLHSLAKNPGHVKSRDKLLTAVYAEDVYMDERTIDSHIKRLRRKFKQLDAKFDQIETLYGVGYRIGGHQSRGGDVLTSFKTPAVTVEKTMTTHH